MKEESPCEVSSITLVVSVADDAVAESLLLREDKDIDNKTEVLHVRLQSLLLSVAEAS